MLDWQEKSNMPSTQPLRRISAAVALLCLLPVTAQASPIWNLESQTVFGPYQPEEWEGTPLEGTWARRFNQVIENTSDDGEELKKYTYPAGSNDNIVHGWINSDFINDEWTLTLTDTETTLTALAGYYIGVNETIIFKFLTTDLIAADDETGLATGVDNLDEDFPALTVNIPAVPEPATLTLLGLGGAGLALRRRRFGRAHRRRFDGAHRRRFGRAHRGRRA